MENIIILTQIAFAKIISDSICKKCLEHNKVQQIVTYYIDFERLEKLGR